MAIWGLIITGSAGFIGINALYSLYSNNNYDFIVAIDKMGYASQYNINLYTDITSHNKRSPYGNNIFRFDCDINNLDQLRSLCNIEKDYWASDWTILDFASDSHVDKSIENPSALYNQNATIPSNLLEWIGKDNWNTIDHYYHISTDEVYGDILLSEKNDVEQYFTPTSLLKPSNPYSASKVAQDMYLTAMCKTFKIPVTIIRMANQFGLWQHPEKMIPASIIRALKGEPIKIYGEGNNCRQWTFVEDTIKAIWKNMNSSTKEINFYNIPVIHLADPKNLMDNNTLIKKLVISLQRHKIISTIKYVTDRLGHDEMYALKVKKEDSEFFTTPFEVALDRTVDFYVERFKNGDFT